MRDWFKFKDGYVNIENDTIFITNTGNWSEVREMIASSWRPEKKDNFLKYWKLLGLLLVVAFYSFYIYHELVSARNGVALAIVIGFAIFKLEKFISMTSNTQQHKIPLDKIIGFDNKLNNYEITYINRKGIEDFYIIRHADLKGIRLLESIMERWVALIKQ